MQCTAVQQRGLTGLNIATKSATHFQRAAYLALCLHREAKTLSVMRQLVLCWSFCMFEKDASRREATFDLSCQICPL